MLNIGDFARYAGLSVRMLRHYDAIGLLSPSVVDPVTGYRSYAPELLTRANALVALKELGFSLEEVGRLLDGGLDPTGLRELLGGRRDTLRQQIDDDRARLAEVERRLRLMEGDRTMSTLTYVEKPLPSLELVQLTDRVDDVTRIGERIGPMFEQVMTTLAHHGTVPDAPTVAWYDDAGEGLRIGAGCVGCCEAPELAAGLEQGHLEAQARAVTAVYRGSMSGIGRAWQELAAYVVAQGLQFAGPCREVYLETPVDDPDAWVTELQQPVS